jgi:hypothetical protein
MVLRKICAVGEYGAEEDLLLEGMLLRKIWGVGVYGTEKDI